MARINFHKISFQNFMSYGNYETVVELDKSKLTLIQGVNGSGKTTTFLALSYNLFGKTFNKAVKTSLINKKNKKGLLTKCWFSIGEDDYCLVRGEKPSILKLEKNGKEIDIDGDSREFQKKLETEILQFDLKTFTRLICLGYNYVRFFELTTQERREFIESVLDLNELSELSKKVKELQKKDSDELIQANLILNGKQSNKEILEKQLDSLSKDNDSIIQQYIEEIEAKKQQNTKIHDEILSLKKKYEESTKFVSEIESNITKEQTKQNKFNQQNSVNKHTLENNLKLIDFLKNHEECPTCKQHIDKSFAEDQIASLGKQNKKLNDEIDKANAEINASNIIIQSNKKDLQEYNEQIKQISQIVTKNKADFANNESRMNELKKQIEKIKNNTNIKELKESIQTAIAYIKEFQDKISKLEKRISIYKTVLEILSDSGVKKSIIDNYINIIIDKVNEYLEDFNCGFDFFMDNEFNETINLDYHDDVKYENLSAGQKQRLDLSIFLTFREIAQLRSKVSTNILLMDEILDESLDQDGVEQLINIFKKQNGLNIFAVSHRAPEQFFNTTLRVNKEKFGFSRMTLIS